MITPALDTGDLAMRLDRLPAELRTALGRQLARALSDRFGSRLSLTIDNTSDTIAATIRLVPLRTAGLRPASPARRRRSRRSTRLRVLRVSSAPFAPPDVSLPNASEIRAALEEAAREAFAR